ncbi:hypothetical protein F5144DRAFT_250003 [Chaetomium tenue]|uniref:Uncharacterized protein n=1 Tax=Chaetomium tenue TaxID=1854479 RepID=A0ACB7P8N9_9PEZI|nr:hypothetical protein F5144DRAFT_250003 [Chaetomium globosum]
MSSNAPGQSAPEKEPVCYNCGVKGHWAFACPEPTRPVPVGLQRWQQHKEHGRSERSGSSRDKKGPIVTHYPPPPPATPATPYGPSPTPPYPVGVTPPPPPPGTAQGYPLAGYPPNPYPGGYQPPPPPPHYGQYPAPPPPPQYAQQSPYGPPSYPPAQYPPAPGYYAPGAPPPPTPPPPSYPPGTYPPQQYGLPPLPPPPSSAAYPPQPGSTPYPSPHYPPQPPPPPPPGAFHYAPSQPSPYPLPQPQYSPPPGWVPPYAAPPSTPHSANQTPLGAHRGRHQKNQGSKRPQHHRDKTRQTNEKHGKGSSRHERRGRRPSRGEQQIKTDDAQTVPEDPERENQGPPEEAAAGKEEKDAPDLDPELEEELRAVFPEIKTNHPADPVGIPISDKYSDDATIPPAYDATCVKSEYFQEDNQKDFVRSIREHPSWSKLRNDPVFKHYPGMATRHFPDCEHEYPSYNPSARPPSPSAIKMPPRFRVHRSSIEAKRDGADEDRRDGRSGHAQHHSARDRQHHDLGRDRLNGDDRDERRPQKRSFDTGLDNDRDDRDLKRNRRWSQKNRSLENHERAISPRQRSRSPPRFNVEGDPWSPQAGETNFKPSGDRRRSDVLTDPKYSPRREERTSYADKRHDSGYLSGQSVQKSGPRYREDDRGRRNSDRSHRRHRSPSRSRSRSRGGRWSRTRGRSRATSSSRSDRNRSESPLDDLEAGLLGLVREPSEPRSKPAAKKPGKKVQVASVYGYASPPSPTCWH